MIYNNAKIIYRLNEIIYNQCKTESNQDKIVYSLIKIVYN